MKRVLIGTFSYWQNGKRTPLNGMIEPLLSYLGPRVHRVDLIDGIHPGSGSVETSIERYEDNRFVSKHVSGISLLLHPVLRLGSDNPRKTQIWFKIRDFLSVPEWLLHSGCSYDLFIGLESIYTLAGIIGKKFGRIKTVVYYVSDYSPNRYSNTLMNSIYHRLDTFCCYHADYIWDVSPAMLPARLQTGLIATKTKPVILVSNALFPAQIKHASPSRIKGASLVYAGSLGIENGPELAIDSVALLIKNNPTISLHFYGGPSQRERELRKIVQRKKLQKHIFFHGLLNDLNQLTERIQYYMIGLAPYRDIPDSLRKYADATKIRLYLGCGLPVVTTTIPPLGKDVAQKNAAIVTRDTATSFAAGISKILKSPELFQNMKKAAIKYSSTNTWEHVYSRAFAHMDLPG